MQRCFRWTLVLLLLALAQTRAVRGELPEDLREYVMSQVTRYEVFAGDDLQAKTELRGEPILLWSQPIQQPHRGGVFVWTRDGRPEALTRIVIFELSNSLHHTFSSLALTRVEARDNGRSIWTPTRRHTDLTPFPEAPAPAKSAIRRLQQIRALAGEFESVLLFEGGIPDNLRVMPRPLFRYQSAEVLDGALLGLAQGNDAKVIVLIEARKDASGVDRWHFAVAPITLHGIKVSLGGKEIVQLPFRNTPHNPKDPYYLRRLSRTDTRN